MFIDAVIQRLSTQAMKGDEASLHYLEMLRKAERFRIDNIADYVRAVFLPEVDGPRDFDVPNEIPNIAPLAECMWFEMHGDLWEREANIQSGCLFIVVHDTKIDGPIHDRPIPSDTRWVVIATFFALDKGSFLTSNFVHFLLVGSDGKPLEIQARKSPFISEREYVTIQGDPEQRNLNPCLTTSLFAICFCHCKNIGVEQEKLSRQARRNMERSKKPVVTFKIIDIHPIKKVMMEEGRVESQGIKRALHFCRAHFAHYTEEHPLFGKYTGTFYRQMHTRGSLKQGAVIKDYIIHEK